MGQQLAATINARFRLDVKEHKEFEAGVLIHQLDGFEDENRKWSPCSTESKSGNCHATRTQARSQRVSASMIFAGLQGRDATIPTFSLDGGVVLRPSKVHAFCGYGVDGSIDDNKPLSCESVNSQRCVPGCGEPPDWCDRDNPHDEGAWATCGISWTRSGVRPWHPKDFGGRGGLLDLYETGGEPFTSVGNFKGYNEIVVDSKHWIEGLPGAVEAIFMIDCGDGDENLRYGAADGAGTAVNCRAAHENIIAVHRTFLQTYKLDARDFPMLKLRPYDWHEPFVVAPEINSDVVGTRIVASAPSSAPKVPFVPAVRCHTCDEHKANGDGLTSAKCDAMLRDRNGKMWSMWDVNGWTKRQGGNQACFEWGWGHFEFDKALRGEGCDRNWLEGTHDWPQYPSPAPALLGFDETIYAYCSAEIHKNEGPFYQDNNGLARRCVDANENVLRVMGGWNMCVNLQWQTCAIKGLLHGQGNRKMHFSIAPKDLDMNIFRNPWACVGNCETNYAISDVYFVEICVISHVCKNREELFALEVGELFECDLDEAAFRELEVLLRGNP